MTAKDLINYTIPPLKLSDNIEKAKQWMTELHKKQFPVVDGGKFYGLFDEDLLIDQRGENSKIVDFDLKSSKVSVAPDEHYYEILRTSYEENIEIVAVIDTNDEYLGVISIQDVIEAFSKMSSINSPGTVIVITMPQIDYSLTEISRIVESEYGKILSCFVENHPTDSSMIRLTIKLNLENSNNIISALERFGFNISSIFGKHEEDQFEKERLDTLMKYLKI